MSTFSVPPELSTGAPDPGNEPVTAVQDWPPEDPQKAKLQAARILVIDDEVANLDIIQRMLTRGIYRNITATTDPRDAVGLYQALKPDLLLLDLQMPHMHGLQVLRQLKEVVPEDTYFPILVVSGEMARDVRLKALALGARDFVSKPFDELELMLRIWNQLKTRFLHLELREALAQRGDGEEVL